MSFLEAAQKLQAYGFEVFPLVANSKLPYLPDFEHAASTEFEKSKLWWWCSVMEVEQSYNIGISTSRFRKGERLIAVDIDVKDGRNGHKAVLLWELEGKILPDTFTTRSANGGTHLLYKTRVRVSNSSNSLAPGIDIRGAGGYVVGPGSNLDGKSYEADWHQIAEAPQWLIDLCGESQEKKPAESFEALAELRAKRYLIESAPLAVSGEGGNQKTYTVAAKVKDFGVDPITCRELMLDNWNDRCDPPWSSEELTKIIENAYRYGKDSVGSQAIENIFDEVPEEDTEPPLPKYIKEMNDEYGFVLAGGGHHVLWETTNADGHPELIHLREQSFHAQHAAKIVSLGEKNGKPIVDRVTKMWMRHPSRRSYKGFVFRPGQEVPPEYYNLFRGFSVEPLEKGEAASPVAQKSLDDFLGHALNNVCQKDKGLFTWLMGYFAHMIQKPWEKPLTAIVMRGAKGVGKGAVVDRVGHLLGSHYLATADRRYLVSNFNGHLENNLLFTLDEAFWSGDKQAEGTLKNLITGRHHVIEHKGQEIFSVENKCRIVIIGNEDWLVPASHDERRFAVFNVGDGKKQDTAFFQQMRIGMEQGGYRALLRYFLDFDLTQVDVNKAPKTEALLDQKLNSEPLVSKWWLESLEYGHIRGGSFDGWQTSVSKDGLRAAYKVWHERQGINYRVPDERVFGKILHKCMDIGLTAGKIKEGQYYVNSYELPTLDEARNGFVRYIGHEMKWS